MDWKYLQAAAFYDNDSFIKDYLEQYEASEEDKSEGSTLTKILHKAAESCSVKVVQAVVNSPHVGDAMGVDAEKGWNGLHFAAAAVEKQSLTPANNYKKLLKIIYLLFKSGIDPMVKDASGKTPQELAVVSGFTAGAALLELLQIAWNHNAKNHTEGQNMTYADTWVHKELLQWAVECDFEEVVSQILKLYHPKANFNRMDGSTTENRRKFLLSLTLCEEWSAFHLATERNCVKAFKALLTHSGVSLSYVVNQCPNDTKNHRGSRITPLSSILIKDEDSRNPLMDVLIQHDKTCKQHDDHPITNVDLSYAYVGEVLCLRIFELESMRTLKISNAQLVELPFQKLSHYPQLLTHLDISNNNLESLPEELFTCFNLDVLNVSHNPLTYLPNLWWKSRSLRRFWANYAQLENVFPERPLNETLSRSLAESQGYTRPEVYHRPIWEVSQMAVFEDNAVSKLRVLDLSNNNISEFPHCFACVFPQLENLNLSKNKLKTVCYIQELPATLGRLDLSRNCLSSMDSVPFDVSVPYGCFISENVLTCCHMVHTELPRLQDLLLSHNPELKQLKFTYSLLNSSTSLSFCENDTSSVDTVHAYFPNLTRLEVNQCNLRDVSCGLDLMPKLRILDISHNPIQSIPLSICHLKDLENFKYEGVEDEIVYDLDRCSSVAAKRYYMKFFKDEAISDPSVRLMFVGLADRGKSTLLNHLRWVDRMDRIPVGWRERMCQENNELDFKQTIGVDQDVWYYSITHDEPNRVEGEQKMITFYTWDFAGQEEYYATHQCYLSRKALYVLCWRVTDGINGVMELKEWLLSIQAKAKDAPVVIVGTHIDLIQVRDRLQTCERLKHQVKRNYCSGLPYYPTIKGIVFVACPPTLNKKDIEIIKDLRRHLYTVASSMQVTVDPRYPKMRLIEQKIPKKYKILHQYVIARAAVMRRHKEPPILKLEDLKQSLQLTPVKELSPMDDSELYYGLQYLKDNGLLLHFDSILLADYYFIDPQWLCDVLAVIVSPLKQINKFAVQKGNVTTEQFYDALTQYGLKCDVHIESILKLLCKFEIVVKLDANNILIPSLLEDITEEQAGLTQTFIFPPNDRQFTVGDITQKKKLYLHSNKSCYKRIFVAPHVPVSFWSRFIARCLSCNYFCQILVNCGKDIAVKRCPLPNKIVVDDELFQWRYGKRSISLLFGDYLLLTVNSTRDKLSNRVIKYYDSLEGAPVECCYKEGFIIYVPSYTVVTHKGDDELEHNETFSPQILAHVLELTDQVMRDHFEGLLDQGIYNDNFLLQLIPCPFCFGDKYPDTMCSIDADDEDLDARYEGLLFCFSVKFCLQKQQEFEEIICFRIHRTNFLDIKHIAPDLAFNDFSSRLKIDHKLLDKKSEKFIHSGGYGIVNRMKLNGVRTVAVKTIHDSLESFASTYGLIRIELNKLSSANHPNVLQFIGVTVVPPAIILEYAPLGSLHDVSNLYKVKNYPICPSSLAMILHQMGKALDYLHQDRFIVHCDIKPSNILVFAFPEAGHNCIDQHFDTLGCRLCQNTEENTGVLVKLADLGTACFIGPEGFSKRPNTPGHNAPEDILYLGRELLTEKVDVFSLGTTLFELMTHRDLPGIVHDSDFSDEIKHGRRPRFLPKDPKYPSVFTECLFSCWNQDYRQRPSPSELVDVFRFPQNVSFLHAYPISKDTQHSFVVVSAEDSQYIWIVSEDRCAITVRKFTESQYSPVFDLIFIKTIQFTDNPVKLLHQVGEMVWVAIEDGRIAICNTNCQNQEICYMETNDFPGNAVNLIKICPINEHTVVLGYASGVLVFVEHPEMRHSSFLLLSVDLELEKLRVTKSIQCQSGLKDVELVSNVQELWCGCDSGLIEIVDLSSCTIVSKNTLNLQSQSPDVLENSAVLQLKLVSLNVFALHRSNVISCWTVSEHSFVKIISPNFQASIIFPLESYLFIGTMCGRILRYSLVDQQLTEIPGRHRRGTKVLGLAALHGKVTHNGLISRIGVNVNNESDSMSLDNEHIACEVLLSLGSGYHEMFKSETEIHQQRMLTWCFLKR